MILRRFMQHVKQQNWLAVAIDILVVIGGVFFATQISIKVENANEAQEMKMAMKQVSAELVTSSDNINWTKQNYKYAMTVQREILRCLEQMCDPNLGEAELTAGLLSIFQLRPLYIQYDLILELQVNGGLKSIPYDDLHGVIRELLFGYKLLEKQHSDSDASISGFTLDHFPFIRTKISQTEDFSAWGQVIIESIDWEQAWQSDNFKNAIALRHGLLSDMTFSLEIVHAMAVEAINLMKRYEYYPEDTWYEKRGQEIEQEIRQKRQQLLMLNE